MIITLTEQDARTKITEGDAGRTLYLGCSCGDSRCPELLVLRYTDYPGPIAAGLTEGDPVSIVLPDDADQSTWLGTVSEVSPEYDYITIDVM